MDHRCVLLTNILNKVLDERSMTRVSLELHHVYVNTSWAIYPSSEHSLPSDTDDFLAPTVNYLHKTHFSLTWSSRWKRLMIGHRDVTMLVDNTKTSSFTFTDKWSDLSQLGVGLRWKDRSQTYRGESITMSSSNVIEVSKTLAFIVRNNLFT